MSNYLDEILDELVAEPSNITPDMYQYWKGLKERRIILNEGISSSVIETVILPLREMDNDGSGEPIEIIMFSGGGDMFSGFALVDVIEKLKTPTTIYIMGLAASMACLIAMAHANNPNVKVVCSKYAVGLIHSGEISLGTQSANAARDFMEFNRRYDEIVKNYIITHTQISEEIYEKIERQEYWMTAQQMLDLGIVSEIV